MVKIKNIVILIYIKNMSVLELNPLAVKFDRFSARIERKL